MATGMGEYLVRAYLNGSGPFVQYSVQLCDRIRYHFPVSIDRPQFGSFR